MKKLFFYALTAVALLSSCSQDDEIKSSASDAHKGLTPIQIGVSTNVNVASRGTGTVGTTDASTNVWNGQTINVLMFQKDALVFATETTENGDTVNLFDRNVDLTAPTGANETLAYCSDKSIKYYPPTGAFDFWGYHLDGADRSMAVNETDATYEAEFEIDGTQDLMVAKTILTAADTAKLVTGANGETIAANAGRAFSAFAARRNVHPTLTFEHLLTRLSFNVKGGDASVCEGGTSPIKVTSIQVASKNTGKVVLAYVPSTRTGVELIKFNDTPAWLSVMQADGDGDTNLDALQAVTPKADNAETTIGEPLLVAPMESYKVRIYLTQEVQTHEGSTATTSKEYTYETDLTNNAGAFVKGTSYKVTVTVWGLSKINITTNLQPWVESDDDIILTPEDDDNALVQQ